MQGFIDGFDLAVTEDHNGMNTGVMIFNCARQNDRLVAFLVRVWGQRNRPAPPGKARQYEQNAIRDLLPTSGLQVRTAAVHARVHVRCTNSSALPIPEGCR